MPLSGATPSMVTASPDSAIFPEFELTERAQRRRDRLIPILGRAGGKLEPVVEARPAEQLPRQLTQLLARAFARHAARQAQRIGAEIGDENEWIGDRRLDALARESKAGRQRSGQRLLHLGIIGGAARLAIDLQPTL